jgi:hypothetical protein
MPLPAPVMMATLPLMSMIDFLCELLCGPTALKSGSFIR